jgi:AcrR family transcriptional regulator
MVSTDPAPRRGRPPVSSRAELESTAFALLLRDGYEATTVQAIITASGVGRTTFFRYFGSKAGIVWGEFDGAVERLRRALDSADDDVGVLAAVRHSVVESTRLSQEQSPDAWLDRFRVIDRDAALASEAAQHWSVWAAEVSGFVFRRTGMPAGTPLPAAIGGAVQAAYVAVLRAWSSSAAEGPVDVGELDDALRPICDALESILPPITPDLSVAAPR